MSVLNQSGEEQVECPLCMEPLEVDDLNFYPCTCGYQICRFCWHRIRTDENGLCPACRKAYSENPADFTPLSKEQVAQLKAEKRARDQQRKAKLSESRKHLASVRVVQRNLVFVVGLPVRLADAEVLRRHEYFGKFGKIHKVVINQSTGYAGSQGPSASAYVTYYKSEDALRAIQSVNNITLDGRLIKSSLGTTKYCSHFMKNQICPKPDCMYLHELGDAEASFTKEEMHQGKHQEYEKRLHEALAASQGTGGGTGKQTGSQQSSQNNGTVVQKEAWPSLSRNGSPPNVGKERKSSTSESKQSSQNNNKTDSSARAEKENTNSNAHQTKPTEKSQRNKHSKFNKHNSTNNNSVSQNNNDNAMNTKNQKMSETKTDKNTANVLEKNGVHNANLIISNGENKKSLNVESTDASKQKLDMNKKETTEKSKSSEVSEATDTDRSDNSSPITQNLSKMSLYEDNTSFFSPNTFQKLISDNESTSFGQESSSVPQTSNILNDNLPDISSSEDWEAAFGFSTTKTTPYSNLSRTSDSPGSSSGVSLPRTSQSDSNVYGSQFGGVSSLNASDQMLDGSVNGLATHRSDVVNSVLTSSNNTNSAFSDTNSAISVNNSSNRNSMFGSLSLQEPVDEVLSHLQKSNDQLRNVNGLDHNMFKFFADFHKNNSLQKDPHEYMNGFGTDHAHAAHSNSLFGTAALPDRQSIGNVQEHLLNGSQQNGLISQQNMLYHQRLMEKQFSDQQLLLNLKNQQQNGAQSPHNLLTNHQTFLNQHAGNSGYQQNFLLQNQINLVQNQHNIIGSVDHGLIVNQNLINSQQNIIGNPQNIINNQQNIINSAASNSLIGNQQHNLFAANQQNLLSNPQTLLNSQASLLAANQQQNMISAAQQSLINQQNHHISNIGSQQGLQVGMLANHSLYPQSQQSLHNLIENQKNAAAFGFGVANQHVIGNTSGQQRVTDDDLGFDPFHETQKALAELMESEQVVNNQQQHRTRLPPPGFSHMNAFGIGLPRPHGSKILPFMGLGGQTNSGTQQPAAVSSQQPTSNGWSMHAQQPNISQSSAHKGLGVINDWTTLDPAIVSSSRHYPLANMPPLRDQFATNMQHANIANGQIRGLDFTNPQQQQQQQQQPNNGYQQGNGAAAFAPSVFQQQNGGQQNAPSSQSYNSQQPQNLIANGYTSTHSWLNATDFQNQIPLPPGFRQNNQQSKTQEC